MDYGYQYGSTYVLFSLLTALVLYIAISVWNTKKRSNFPPGPKGVTLFGNLLDIRKHLPEGPRLFTQWAREFGDVYSLRLGVYDAVVINNYDLFNEAFVKYKDHTSGRATNVFFVKWTTGNRGIIQNDGATWQSLRRKTLRTMHDLGMGKTSLEFRIQEEALAVVEVMEQYNGKPFCPKFLLHSAFSNVICSLIFGRRFEYSDKAFKFIAHHLDRLFSSGGFKNPEMFIPMLTPVSPITNWPFCKVGFSFLAIQQYLKKRITEQKARQDSEVDNLIHTFLRDNSSSDNKQNGSVLLDILFDLFISGSETSTTLTDWALLYLVNYPEIQKKCQKEVIQVIGQSRQPVMADKRNMTYLQAFINELMRVANIAPLAVLHRCTSDFKLSSFTIPKNTLLIPNIHSIHMDPTDWKDPETFSPDRWIDSEGKLLQFERFVPFSIGPRECLGKSMAHQEIFIILVTLLQHFTFLPEDPDNPPALEGVMGFTYGPKEYKIRVIRNTA